MKGWGGYIRIILLILSIHINRFLASSRLRVRCVPLPRIHAQRVSHSMEGAALSAPVSVERPILPQIDEIRGQNSA